MKEGAIGVVSDQEVVEPGEVRDREFRLMEKPGRHGLHLGSNLFPGHHPPLQLLTPVHNQCWASSPNLKKQVVAKNRAELQVWFRNLLAPKKCWKQFPGAYQLGNPTNIHLRHDLGVEIRKSLAKFRTPNVIVGRHHFEPVKPINCCCFFQQRCCLVLPGAS